MQSKWWQLAAAILAAVLATLGNRQFPGPQPPITLPPIVLPPVAPPAPAEPAPKTPPAPPKADPLAAIGRIQFGNAGCTATIIGPRLADGRYWALTAAHCVSAKGQRGSMRLRDGRSFGLVVQAIDRESDCCWCLTDTNAQELPHATVARSSPAVGSRIWHAGYGVDVPGNREDGTVEAGPNAEGQIRMRLSVSSGDSGGGICLNDSGEVISCVCCTTERGAVAQVWGASPEAIHRLKPAFAVSEEWTPLEIPHRMPEAK